MKNLIVFFICLNLCACGTPSNTYLKTIKVKSVNCMGPMSDILFSEDGYCKFIAVSGEKCVYDGVVVIGEEIRVCAEMSRAGLTFIRECASHVSIQCGR